MIHDSGENMTEENLPRLSATRAGNKGVVTKLIGEAETILDGIHPLEEKARNRGSCVVYEPLDRYVGRHVDRHIMSTDISLDCRSTYRPMLDRYVVDISTDSRPMCRSTRVGRHVGRHIGRYVGRYVDRHISIDISAECRSTCRSIGYRHSADTSLLLAYW